MNSLFSSLRVRCILLVLLAIIPALVLSLYSNLEQRHREGEDAQNETLRVVHLANDNQEAIIEGTHQLLIALAQLPEVRSGDERTCSSLLGKIREQSPRYANLGVIGLDGYAFCSALPRSGRVYLADRRYFQQALATQDFSGGEYQIGRITGQPSINFGYPLLDEQGNVQAVVFAALDLRWLNDLAATLDLREGVVLFTVDAEGTILTRYPDGVEWIGQPLPDAPVVQAILAQQEEGTVETAGLDGINRLYAFTPLSGDAQGETYISAGIPTAIAYEAANRALLRSLIGLTILGLLSLAMGAAFANLFILRPVNALIRATRRLTGGDLSARTELAHRDGELGQLARTFDEMAQTLERRAAQRRQAEDDVRRQAARAEALVQIAARLNGQLELEEVLHAVCEEAAAALSVPAASVSLYDESVEAFFIAAAVGLPPAAMQHAQGMPRALYEAYTHEGPVIVARDVQAIPDLPNAALYSELDIRTVVAASMVRDDKLVGTLTVNSFGEIREFNEDELALLQALADQAAQAISNARLYDQAQRRLRRLRALNAIDRAITARYELPETLNVVLEQVTTQLEVDAAAILLLNEEARVLEFAAGSGFHDEGVRHSRIPVGEGYSGWVALARHPLAIPDLENTEGFVQRPLIQEEGFVSYCGVPLVAEDHVQGVLSIFQRKRLDFEDEWMGFLEALALQAAIAIDNSRLFGETRLLLEKTQLQAQQVRQIIDSMPEGVLLLNAHRSLIMANPLGETYLNQLLTSDGDTITQLGSRSLDELLQPIPEGHSWHELGSLPSGHFFEVASQPVTTDEQTGGWVLVLRNVTEERERQEYLQAQDRLATVGQLAAGIAHDFNNIMAVISLYSQALTRDPTHPRCQDYLTTIQQQSIRASDLISQILDFSRSAPVSRRQMDLLPFVKEVTRLLRRTLPESITVSLHAEPGEYIVKGDATRLQQVLMNLAVNARDAMPEGGQLTISLSSRATAREQSPLPDMRPGKYICLTVDDSGSGIPDDVLLHIFEPFFTTKARGHGTGLGLAQVYGIVKQHEGDIAVETRPGEGTTFTIYLPSANCVDAVQGGADASSNDFHGGTETILVVEDDPHTRTALCEALDSLGYEVLEAQNGQEALAVLREQAGTIDLVLSDMVMPTMGGAPLQQKLQVEQPDVRLILITGYPLDDEGKVLLEQDGVTWIQKPFDVDKLAQKIREALNGA